MGACKAYYREWRFVIDDDLTHAFVWIDAIGDCPLGVQGWHYKAFPTSVPVQQILVEAFKTGDERPIDWPQKAPGPRSQS